MVGVHHTVAKAVAANRPTLHQFAEVVSRQWSEKDWSGISGVVTEYTCVYSAYIFFSTYVCRQSDKFAFT